MASVREQAQAAVLDWLGDPATHGGSAPVKRIDTQGAVVFLAGDDAYKIRRPIRLPFLDYSTLEKRRAACEAEFALNAPSAPAVYLGAVPVTREPSGFGFGGPGEIVEWATHMRRFDEDATLDRLAARGALSHGLIGKLARAIRAAHQRAPIRDADPAIGALETWLDQNRDAIAARRDLFAPRRAVELDSRARAALEGLRPLLRERGQLGYVRRCHGDLHLRNIAVIAGEPVPFDAIEFDDAVATGDLLYDLAFPVMDLWERGLTREANLLLNDYLAEGEEAHYGALAALPFFLSLRAAIRAKVEAANLGHVTGEACVKTAEAARRYFDFACRFLGPSPTWLVAIGGLSGTGKSALAGLLAPEIGGPPGAIWLRSDVERKHLFGVGETTRLPFSAYGEAASRETYARLFRKAELALRAGRGVILDAVQARADERAAAARLAAETGAEFAGIWLEAPWQTRERRVARRAGDASDAGERVAAAQRADPLGEPGWRALDASKDLAATAFQAKRRLAL